MVYIAFSLVHMLFDQDGSGHYNLPNGDWPFVSCIPETWHCT